MSATAAALTERSSDERRQRVALLMAEMRSDPQAVFQFAESFRGELAAAVYRHLRDLGTHSVSRDDLDSLVLDAALAIQKVAGGWRADRRALPWVWAQMRIRAVVVRYLGVYTTPIEYVCVDLPDPTPAPASSIDEEPLDTLETLAGRDPQCRALAAALAELASDRDSRIFLGVRVQAALGDLGPAATVARQYGLTAETVRQVVHRTRVALALAAASGAFPGLSDLPIIQSGR